MIDHIRTSFLLPVFVFCLIFSMSGCMSIAQSIIGIKDAQLLSNEEIVKSSKKFKLDQQNNYRLDTLYLSYLLHLDTSRLKEQIKNHYQPLQALYFNDNGDLMKFYINCYAGGFPQLKWNRDGMLDSFLPKDQAPTDTLINLMKLSAYLIPVSHETKAFSKDSSDYFIFIFWNKCTKRHSKRLIKSIRQNVSKAGNNKIRLSFVNYDAVFYSMQKRNQ